MLTNLVSYFMGGRDGVCTRSTSADVLSSLRRAQAEKEARAMHTHAEDVLFQAEARAADIVARAADIVARAEADGAARTEFYKAGCRKLLDAAMNDGAHIRKTKAGAAGQLGARGGRVV